MENLIVLTPAWSSMKEPQKRVPTMKSIGGVKAENGVSSRGRFRSIINLQ